MGGACGCRVGGRSRRSRLARGSGGVSPAQWFGRRVPCSRADRAPGPIPEVVRRSRPPLRASFATGHRGQVRSAGDLTGPDADRPGWPLQTEGFGADPRREPDRTSVRARGGAKMPGKGRHPMHPAGPRSSSSLASGQKGQLQTAFWRRGLSKRCNHWRRSRCTSYWELAATCTSLTRRGPTAGWQPRLWAGHTAWRLVPPSTGNGAN